MANLNWNDLGAIETGIFAKHEWACKYCGHKEISRFAPKEYCNECAKKKFEQYDQFKNKFK